MDLVIKNWNNKTISNLELYLHNKVESCDLETMSETLATLVAELYSITFLHSGLRKEAAGISSFKSTLTTTVRSDVSDTAT
jgi:hypothetical protein